MRLAISFFTFFLVSILFGGYANAQKSGTDNLQKEANKLFEEAKYAEAYPLFTQLLSLQKGDPDITFKYGATLLYGSEKKAEAIPYLKKASARSNIDLRVYYFLGKAYQLNYEFDKALSAYEEFRQKGDAKQIEKYRLSLSIQQCENGKSLLSQIKDVLVLDKTDVDSDEFFRYYELENLDGKILLAPEEFQSSVDKKKGHRPIIYTTPLSNIVYFSSYGKKGDNGTDIYYASRKGDGTWSEPFLLPAPINTKFNEDYPFMHSDGKTLYFCSEGHNSMGGFDIFRSTIEASTGSFTQPENLDFAINTPDDDLFYIADSLSQNAFFASARSSKQGQLSVYQVKVDLIPSSIILIKGQFISELDPSLKDARITIEDAQNKRQLGVFNTESGGEYILDFKYGGAYNFYVEAGGSGIIHTGKVEIPRLESISAFRQELIMIDDNGVERLMIKNYFDEELDEDAQELLAFVLKRRADLEITPEDEMNEQLKSQQESLASANFDNLYLSLGMNQFHSNEEVANWLDMKSLELSKGNEKYSDLSSKAYAESINYQKLAEDQIKEADESYAAFENAENNDEKEDRLRSFITLRNDAKVNLLNAGASMLISDRINTIMKDREETVAEIQSEELLLRQGILDNDEELVSSSLKRIEKLNSTLKATKYQADPSIYLADIKELEKMKAMQAYDAAEDFRLEKNDQIELVQRLETQLAKAKDNEKAQIQARIEETKGEIQSIESAMPEKWEDYRNMDWNSKLAERSLEFANSWDYSGTADPNPLQDQIVSSSANIQSARDNVQAMEDKEEAALLSLGVSYQELMRSAELPIVQNDPQNPMGDDVAVDDNSETNNSESLSIENTLISDFDKKVEALEETPNSLDQLEGKIVLNAELLTEVNRNLKEENPEFDKEELQALKSQLEIETVQMIDQFKKEIEANQESVYSVEDFIPEYEKQKENIESYSGSELEIDAKLSEFYAYSVDKLELILDSLNTVPFPEYDAYLMRQHLESQNALKIIIAELKVENYELKENVELLSTIADLPTEEEVISSINEGYDEKYNSIKDSEEEEDVKAAQLIQLNESLIVGLNEQLAVKTQEFENASEEEKVLVSAEIDLLNQIKEEKGEEIDRSILDMASGVISADPLVEANEVQDIQLDEEEKELLVNGVMPEYSQESDAIEFSEMNPAQKRVKTLALYTSLNGLLVSKVEELQTSESDDLEIKKYQYLESEVKNSMQSLQELIEEDKLQNEESVSQNESVETESNAWSGVLSYNAASLALEEYKNEGRIAKDPGFSSESLKVESELYYTKIDALNILLLNYADLENREKSLSEKEQKKSRKARAKLAEDISEKEAELLENWIPLIHVSAEDISMEDDYLAISKSLLAESVDLKGEEKTQKLKEAYVLSIMSLKNGHHQQLDDNRVAGLPIAKQDGDGLDFNSLTIREKKVLLTRNIEKFKENILDIEEQKSLNADDELKLQELNIIAKSYQEALVWNQNKLASLNTKEYEIKAEGERQISFIKAPTGQEQFSDELEKIGINRAQSEIITSDLELQNYYAMFYVEREVQNRINILKKMRSAYREEGDRALENYYDGSLITQGTATEVINDYNENGKRYQQAISWYQKTDSLDLLITSLESKQNTIKNDMDVYYNDLEPINKQTIADLKEGKTPSIAVIEDPIDSSINEESDEEFIEPEEESVIEVVFEDDTLTEDEQDIPKMGDPTLKGYLFEIGRAFYSEEAPIPVDPPLPEGLIYKIQIGAYRKAPPAEHFIGLSPMMAEKLQNGITRYSVGVFNLLDEAKDALVEVRDMNYSDAFIVAFYNGSRISLDQAQRIVDGEDASSIAGITNDQTGLNQGQGNENLGSDSRPRLNELDNESTIAAQDVSLIPSLFYTVQVGVYSKELKNGDLNRIGDLNVEKTGSGYYRYTSGRFDDLFEASSHKRTVVENGVRDAFVTAYSNGSRISVTRAQSIEKNEGESVDETESAPVQPIVIQETQADPEEVIEEIQKEENLPEESELRFVIFIGSYSNNIPNNVASALLQNSDVGIKRAVNGGKTIYSTKEITTYTEATIILQRFQELGVEQAKMLYVLNGSEISQNEAFKILKQ